MTAFGALGGDIDIGAPRNAFGHFWILLGDAPYARYLTNVFVMIGYGRLIKIFAITHLPATSDYASHLANCA